MNPVERLAIWLWDRGEREKAQHTRLRRTDDHLNRLRESQEEAARQVLVLQRTVDEHLRRRSHG